MSRTDASIDAPGMAEATFARFQELVYRKSGITLGKGKEALVRARVGKRMRTLGLDDYDAYLRRVTEDASGEELVQLLDVISTNVTSFFREESHFRLLADLAKGWRAEGRSRIRLWSAASSTGEEVYTMGMTVLEAFEGRIPDLRILGTDISTRVLDAAREGVYGADKAASIPPALRNRWFEPRGAGRIAAGEALRAATTFARLNLSTPPFPMQGPFDVVFCRNVMIYFDDGVRRRLLTEIVRLLRPGGHLMVGHAESLAGLVPGLRGVGPAAYVKA